MSNEWNKSPVYVGGNAKSGTTLLACLIDNHPNIFCLPKEVPYKPIGALLKPGDIAMSDEKELLDLLVDYVMRRFALLRPYSDQETQENLEAFKKLAGREKAPESFTDVYSIITRATLKAYKVTDQPIAKWSFKNVGKKTYHHFLDTYPLGKIVHIRRDPHSWILSRITSLQRKGRDISQYSFLQTYRAIRDWRRFESYAENIQARYGRERVAFVSYEDLVLKPEEVLGKIWTFLDVEPVAGPFAPTVFKRPTSPDTARDTQAAIYTQAVDDWKDHLKLHIRLLVNILAGGYKNPQKICL